MQNKKSLLLVWSVLLIYLAYLLAQLALFDNLSSVANDSINYLAMARYYSPWQQESEAIRQVWAQQDFPPLFPMVLALSGAAHSFYYAHLLVLITGLFCLILLYRFTCKILERPDVALGVVVIFALSPGFLLGLQGILSESLFLLLSLLFLLFWQEGRSVSTTRIVMLGLLLAAILLTRTIGIALLLALMIHGLVQAIRYKSVYQPALPVLLCAVLAYLLMMSLIGPEKDSHYPGVISHMLAGGSAGNASIISLQHLHAILEAWHTHWLIYWLSELSVTYLVVLLIAAMALIEWVKRVRRNRVDAWYVFFYLGILAIWPHPGQMLRLLFPIAPLLLVYAFSLATGLMSKIPDRGKSLLVPFSLFVVVIISILPAHAFLHGRIELAREQQLVPVYEIFRKPDPGAAIRDLVVHNQMLLDFSSIADHLDEQARVLYYSPAYLSVLGNVRAYAMQYPVDHADNIRLINSQDISHLLLTVYHPRMTREGIDGFTGFPAISSRLDHVRCTGSDQLGMTISCLYRVSRQGMDRQ